MTDRRVLIPLALLALLWGASFLFIKLAIEGMTPAQMVLWRVATGTAVLLVIALARKESLPREPRLLGHLVVLSVVANLIPWFLFGWGEQHISSSLAGVLNGTTPLFTLVFAVAALPEERLTSVRVAGLLVGFAGVVVVAGPWQAGVGGTFTGQLACLVAAACYGVAFVYTRKFVANRGYAPLALSTTQLGIGTILLTIAAPFVAADPMELTWAAVIGATALGALGTGLAYVLFYRLISLAGATSASTVTYAIPVVAVVLGIIVLGEPVTWNLFVGAAIVVGGVALAEGRLGARTVDEPVVPQEVA